MGDTRPTIHLQFSDPLRTGTVRLLLDNRDVTSQAQIYGNTVTYTPPHNLAYGQHQAAVRAVDSSGNLVDEQWSFRIDQGYAGSGQGGQLDLVLTNLSSGASVPGVFNIQGRTEPYATVRVEAVSTRVLIPGWIGVRDKIFTASGRADANGRFDVQLDASSAAKDAPMDITVTSHSSTNAQTNSVEVDVTRR
ncbi:MAG: hypothetical protein HY319_02390 [Armatimonadetes bacterium]|nr:hypothetical protein [Armatimonadota bacterium]